VPTATEAVIHFSVGFSGVVATKEVAEALLEEVLLFPAGFLLVFSAGLFAGLLAGFSAGLLVGLSTVFSAGLLTASLAGFSTVLSTVFSVGLLTALSTDFSACFAKGVAVVIPEGAGFASFVAVSVLEEVSALEVSAVFWVEVPFFSSFWVSESQLVPPEKLVCTGFTSVSLTASSSFFPKSLLKNPIVSFPL
jgi:hypothetical protein